jgi:hypothetical protein
MNKTPKYLLAKYIPDLRRGEPRNIGVIVWSPEGVEARFLAEKENRLGDVDGRSVPPFVTSITAYKQWVAYWRTEIDKSEIEPATGGKRVEKASDQFLETLQAANKGNFVLEHGGEILDQVSEEELSKWASHLFVTLVESSGQDEPRDPTLDEVCNELLETSELIANPNFHNQFRVKCQIKGVEEEYTFSHAYKNGKLERLYQRVPFPKRRKGILKKNVHDAAWTFEKIIEARIIDQAKTAALVYVSDEQRGDPEIERSIDVLKSVTNVLDLRDHENVLKEFQQLSLLNPH